MVKLFTIIWCLGIFFTSYSSYAQTNKSIINWCVNNGFSYSEIGVNNCYRYLSMLKEFENNKLLMQNNRMLKRQHKIEQWKYVGRLGRAFGFF